MFQKGTLSGTIVATDRISIPSGDNLSNINSRTLVPSSGSLAYEPSTNLIYYGDTEKWNLFGSGPQGCTGCTGPTGLGSTGPTGLGATGPTGMDGKTGPTGLGATGMTGVAGSSSIGIEALITNNGTATQPFTRVGAESIWTSNGGTNLAPNFGTTTAIWAPFGSATSYITITPGALNVPDFFVCSKNIRILRFYTIIQTSVATTSRWRTNIFLNGVNSGTGNYWGAPPNNVGNQRVFGVLELGGIAAGTQITVKIDHVTLPVSTQNNSSYFVIEYDI